MIESAFVVNLGAVPELVHTPSASGRGQLIARCPKCHKRMEMLLKGQEETFVCQCGYKEKLSSFQARRAKEGAGVNKRDVQRYLKKQQKEANEPVNNAFAQALSGIKLD